MGWTEGHNVSIDTRWAAGNITDMHKHAAELVTLAPDVILAVGGPDVEPLLQATRTVPIVFTLVADPIGSGFVDSLSRPGGNVTGFMQFESACAENGWNCSRRSRQALREWPPFGIPPIPPDRSVRRHPVRGAVGRRGRKPD